MTYDPNRHHRHSIRLRGYDYRQAGAYFVTICTQNRECVFGQVVEGQIVLNAPGQMIESVWRELPQYYPGVQVDAFVVMPNHLHGIIILAGAGASACPDYPGQPWGVAPAMSLPEVIQRFKSLTTAKYRRAVLQGGWQPFPGRLWQRNYYERVIRSEKELAAVRQYIDENSLLWAEDPENPRLCGHLMYGRAPVPAQMWARVECHDHPLLPPAPPALGAAGRPGRRTPHRQYNGAGPCACPDNPGQPQGVAPT